MVDTVSKLDREKVIGWVEGRFVVDRSQVMSVRFSHDELPRAEIVIRSMDPNGEVFSVLGIDPQGVTSVEIKPRGAFVYYTDWDGRPPAFIPFEDVSDG
jgi:hypothetical protein